MVEGSDHWELAVAGYRFSVEEDRSVRQYDSSRFLQSSSSSCSLSSEIKLNSDTQGDVLPGSNPASPYQSQINRQRRSPSKRQNAHRFSSDRRHVCPSYPLSSAFLFFPRRAVLRASSRIGPGNRRQPWSASSKAFTKISTSFSVMMSGGNILITSMLWPATWVRIRCRLNNGTITSWAKRP
jgi:hypothetical protein